MAGFLETAHRQKKLQYLQVAIFAAGSLQRRVTPLCTSPPPPSVAINIIILPAGALCELPRLFGGNSHSDAACNFCPDQLGCVRLTRPVRVHRLPRKLGLLAAAPIVRIECGRGVG